MPILVEAEVTKDEVAKMIADAVAAERARSLAAAGPPATKKAVSYATAIRRGLTAYDYVAMNGPLDKRVGVLEQAVKADALDDEAEAKEQDDIEAALAKPIRPRP